MIKTEKQNSFQPTTTPPSSSYGSVVTPTATGSGQMLNCSRCGQVITKKVMEHDGKSLRLRLFSSFFQPKIQDYLLILFVTEFKLCLVQSVKCQVHVLSSLLLVVVSSNTLLRTLLTFI